MGRLLEHRVNGAERLFIVLFNAGENAGDASHGESFMLRLEDGQVTHWDTADPSLDLAIYLHDQGFDMPRGVARPAIVEGKPR